ncbi:MAG TPA: ribonuclease P protein component [Terracidiphilus sp.]|nr:ribonuclease P protein component [Terracidiphilus sp.]
MNNSLPSGPVSRDRVRADGAQTTRALTSRQALSGQDSLAPFRLRSHADFQRAYAAGRKRQSSSMSWFLAPQGAPAESPRVGLTVGKVMGKAHDRNRMKRRMREALRRHVELLPEGFDLILHPRRAVLTADFRKLEAEVVRILGEARAEAERMKPGAGPDSA